MAGSSTEPIKLRDARYLELPAVAHVMAQAFWEDNLFGELIHPNREQFSDDVDLYWLRRARVNFWDYRWKWLVAVAPNPRSGPGEQPEIVVGIAQWARLGDGGKVKECAWFDPRRFLILFSIFQSIVGAERSLER